MELYPEPWRKCAILGSRICRNHPFPDGNKRVAFLAMLTFARLNGAQWEPAADAGSVIVSLAAGEIDEDECAQWLRVGWHDNG